MLFFSPGGQVPVAGWLSRALEQLAKDQEEDVRRAVAENLACSIELLEKRCEFVEQELAAKSRALAQQVIVQGCPRGYPTTSYSTTSLYPPATPPPYPPPVVFPPLPFVARCTKSFFVQGNRTSLVVGDVVTVYDVTDQQGADMGEAWASVGDVGGDVPTGWFPVANLGFPNLVVL